MSSRVKFIPAGPTPHMLRFLSRFLGLWLLAGALIALVVDGSKSIAAGRLVPTPFGGSWLYVHPPSLEASQAGLSSLHPALWDPVFTAVLAVPTFMVLAVLGALLLFAGRKKRVREAELDLR